MVLAPCGVASRTSRTPGRASAATVNFTFIFVMFGFSPSLTSGGTASPVTPSPETSTRYVPSMLYRVLNSTSAVCPTCTATGLRLITIG